MLIMVTFEAWRREEMFAFHFFHFCTVIFLKITLKMFSRHNSMLNNKRNLTSGLMVSSNILFNK